MTNNASAGRRMTGSSFFRVSIAVKHSKIDAKEPPHLLKRIEVYPGTHVHSVGHQIDGADLCAYRYPHEHIELQLAHAPRNAVSAAYNHVLHLKGRTKMMQEWADFLEQTQRGAKVLQFREV